MRLIDGDKLSQEIEYMYLGSDTKENHRVCAETEDTMIGKFQVIDTIFGIPTVFEIPDNATNGDMIKALFPNAEYWDSTEFENEERINFEDNDCLECLNLDWWNAPYKKGESNEKDKTDN